MASKKSVIVAPRRPPTVAAAPTPEQIAEQERRELAFIGAEEAPRATAARPPDQREEFISGPLGGRRTPTAHPADTSQVSPGHLAGVSQTPGGHPPDASGAPILEDLPLRGQTPARHPAGVPQVPGGHPKPRAPAGTAAKVTRADGRVRVRFSAYLTEETRAALRAYVARVPGDEAEHVELAVAEYLRKHGALE